MCRGFESHPSSSFFFSEKKELFGLVAFPFFLFIGGSFHEEPKAAKERVVAQVPSKYKCLCDVFLAACIPHNNYT